MDGERTKPEHGTILRLGDAPVEVELGCGQRLTFTRAKGGRFRVVMVTPVPIRGKRNLTKPRRKP